MVKWQYLELVYTYNKYLTICTVVPINISLLTVCKQLIPLLHQVENGAEGKEKEDEDEKKESSRAVEGSITWREDIIISDEMQVE